MPEPQENGHTITTEPWMEKENLDKWLKTSVKEIKSEHKNLKGDNYLSSMKKLTVMTEDGRTIPMVVKCRLLNGTVADVFGNSDIFKKEVEFYGNTIHAIQDILSEVFPDDEEPIAAKCYYACEDYLVLEDLVASGFKMHNRRIGLNLEQCLLVMRTLAKLHAGSVILNERNPRALEKLKKNFYQEPTLLEPLGNFIKGFAETLIEELKTWDEEWHQYIPKLEIMAKENIYLVGANSECRDSDFNVLIHGDLWINNMLLRGASEAIRFVDYQIINFSSPALDLIYFIATSAITDVQLNHIRRLIEEYHKNLSYILKSLDYSKHIPTLEELYRELDRKAPFGLYTVTAPHAVMKCDPECGFSFDEILKTAKTPGPSMYDESYKKSLKVMLPLVAGKVKFENGV